jgi:hypothetical protein
MIGAILRSTRGRIVLAVLVAWLAWQAWLSLAAPGKVSAEIDRSRARVNLLVTLPFRPERFHVLMFQKFGRVSGTTDDAVELRGVAPANLNSLARYYWVRRVDPLPPDQ